MSVGMRSVFEVFIAYRWFSGRITPYLAAVCNAEHQVVKQWDFVAVIAPYLGHELTLTWETIY